MHAEVGDKLVRQLGDHKEVGIIREVHGADGSPPYVVEWSDVPGEHIVWPGPDASVEQFEHRPVRRKSGKPAQRATKTQPST